MLDQNGTDVASIGSFLVHHGYMQDIISGYLVLGYIIAYLHGPITDLTLWCKNYMHCTKMTSFPNLADCHSLFPGIIDP